MQEKNFLPSHTGVCILKVGCVKFREPNNTEAACEDPSYSTQIKGHVMYLNGINRRECGTGFLNTRLESPRTRTESVTIGATDLIMRRRGTNLGKSNCARGPLPYLFTRINYRKWLNGRQGVGC